MLIYNHKKEFVGIGENDLKLLSLLNLGELFGQVSDFADLFIKSPGFIHNFQHIHWIDYITCNEDGVEPKAIIEINGVRTTFFIEIQTIYLLDEPSKKAYAIYINTTKNSNNSQIINMQTVTANEIKIPPKKPEQVASPVVPDIVNQTLEIVAEVPKIEKEEIFVESSLYEAPKQEPEIKENTPKRYIYNPAIVSSELGLPVDLVEEFIQDFIIQADSFKHDIYLSLANGDISKLKTQAHKLKGVAANLRIENALEALIVVNTSTDEDEIKQNLDIFYAIIDDFSKPQSIQIQPAQVAKNSDSDDLILSIKEDLETPKTDFADSFDGDGDGD
jgi:hypothetical protein